MTRLLRMLVAVMLVLITSSALALPASAHTDLRSSTPADGAVLDTRPTEVSFTFVEPLMPDFVRFIAIDEAGTTSELLVNAVDGGTAVVGWPPEFAPGTWTVEYRVVSEDGHPVNGKIAFSYDAPTPSPSSSSASSSSAPSSSTAPAPSTSSAAAPTEVTSSAAPATPSPSPTLSPVADTSSSNTGWIIAGIAVLVLAAIAIAGLIARNRT